MSEQEQWIWYFSYGSNLDPERFRSRVGPWTQLRRAVLHDHVLMFSGEVESEGGGGAIVEPAPGEETYGAVFRIDRNQLRAMDEIELSSERNVEGKGVRLTVVVETDEGPLDAEVYTLPAAGRYRAPSTRYLGHIIDGLRTVGHPDAVVARVHEAAKRKS
jgi:gamma-glutamylcyclotransferase (GGCT)/AIG2-like uncharacterized protein YtfP